MWVHGRHKVAWASGITRPCCYATVCLFKPPWLILHGMCSNLRDVCVTLHQYLIILTDFSSPLSSFLMFFSLLQFHASFGTTVFCPHCASLSSSPLLYFHPPVLRHRLPGDSGVYARTLRGFWILRKFGFNSLLPTAFFDFMHQYFIRLLVKCGVHGYTELLLGLVQEWVLCFYNINWFNWFEHWLSVLQTICQKTPKDSTQYEECKKALQAVSKVRGFKK